MSNVSIVKSSRELTNREVLKITQRNNAHSIDTLTKENGKCVINPDLWVVVRVEADGKEPYERIYLIQGDDMFSTASVPFMQSFDTIVAAMKGEAFSIEAFRALSKRTNKEYLMCAIL